MIPLFTVCCITWHVCLRHVTIAPKSSQLPLAGPVEVTGGALSEGPGRSCTLNTSTTLELFENRIRTSSGTSDRDRRAAHCVRKKKASMSIMSDVSDPVSVSSLAGEGERVKARRVEVGGGVGIGWTA
jgi:hypothetical protein